MPINNYLSAIYRYFFLTNYDFFSTFYDFFSTFRGVNYDFFSTFSFFNDQF